MRQWFIGLFSLLCFLTVFNPPAQAFWVWTPETNKWVNPKYAVKDTPKEQLQYAQEFFQSKDYPKAINEFQKLIKFYPRAREAAEAQYYTGFTYETQGRLMDAFKSYQLVIDKYPFSERAPEIIKRQYDMGNTLLNGKDNRNKIIKTIVGGEYDVVEVFRKVIKNAPYGEYAAPSQYKIGLYLQEKGLYQEARDEFEKTMDDYPNSEWAKAAKYQLALSDSLRSGKAQYNQKVTQVAIDQFKDFVKENPDAQLSQSAKDQISKLKEKEAQNIFIIAQFYEKQKKPEAAKIYYNTIVDDYKMTSLAPKALERLQVISTKTK